MTDAISGFHQIGIVVESIEETSRRYVEHLGFERQYTYGWPGVQAAFICRGLLRVELFQNDEACPMAGGRRRPESNLKIGGINHFAIEVANLDAMVRALNGKGVEIVSAPRAIFNGSGDRFAFIHDRDKMLVELVQPA